MPIEWRRGDLTPEQYAALAAMEGPAWRLAGGGPYWGPARVQAAPRWARATAPAESVVTPPWERASVGQPRPSVRVEERDLYPTTLAGAVADVEQAGRGGQLSPPSAERRAYLGQLLYPPTRVPGAYGMAWTPPETGAGTGGGAPAANIPDAWRPMGAGWWREFMGEHGGTTPADFYGQQREGVEEAYADRQWGNEFYQMYGRPPTQGDWENHWYETRTGHGRPLFSPEQWRYMRRLERANRRTVEPTPQQRAPMTVANPVTWRTGPY